MKTKHAFGLLTAVAALALAACGGGGGAHIASTPPPPPTPTPTPTPTPGPYEPVIFPAVTASTQFATVGYESAGHPIQTGTLIGSGFSVSYDAQSNVYLMDVPGSDPGVFEAKTTGDRYWNGTLLELAFGFEQPIVLNVFRPGSQNWDFADLKYTSFAEYQTTSGRFGEMAFGLPTDASAVPVSGSATYDAFAAGQSDDGLGIRGTVLMQFDFGAGTLSGSFDPYIYDLLAGNTPLGHYDFTNTVYGTGSATFSGQLSRSGTAEKGTFDGQFTGPNAEEVMARWTAPLPDPDTNTTSVMFGVWVGKKRP